VRTFLVVLTICFLASCGSPTGSSDIGLPLNITTFASFNPRGPIVTTPSGWFDIYAHDYGEVTQWHIDTFDASWIAITQCLGVETEGILSNYPILLYKRENFSCGNNTNAAGCYHYYGEDGHHISIIGSSFDFDPHNPEATPDPTLEFVRLVRHELLHLAFQLFNGDPNVNHDWSEWRCQYPPGHWDLNKSNKMDLNISPLDTLSDVVIHK